MSGDTPFDPLGLSELDPSDFEVSDFPHSMPPAEGEAPDVAAWRAFVDMKDLFLRAVEDLQHRKGAWLRGQVRAAGVPIDLWLLRGPLLAALREDEVATRSLRAELYRTLDHTFPNAFGNDVGRTGHSTSMRG